MFGKQALSRDLQLIPRRKYLCLNQYEGSDTANDGTDTSLQRRRKLGRRVVPIEDRRPRVFWSFDRLKRIAAKDHHHRLFCGRSTHCKVEFATTGNEHGGGGEEDERARTGAGSQVHGAFGWGWIAGGASSSGCSKVRVSCTDRLP